MTSKAQILQALTDFAEQTPNMIAEDYNTRDQYAADHDRYCAEPLAEFRAMREIVEGREDIDGEALTRAIQWTSRISLNREGGIDYIPGQNGALEFRTAACNVLSQALIESWRPETPEGAKPLPHAEAMAAEQLGERIAGRHFQ